MAGGNPTSFGFFPCHDGGMVGLVEKPFLSWALDTATVDVAVVAGRLAESGHRNALRKNAVLAASLIIGLLSDDRNQPRLHACSTHLAGL